MNRRLLIDSVGTLNFTPEQINESMDKNNGKLILTGVMQRADATNQNGREYPEGILKRESEKYKKVFVAEKRALAVKRQLTKIYEIKEDRILVFSERDAFVKKYKMQTEGLDRKVEFRLIRKP